MKKTDPEKVFDKNHFKKKVIENSLNNYEEKELGKIKIKMAEFFRLKREQKKLSIRKLAKISEVSYMVVFRIENGTYQTQKGSYQTINPSINILYKILKGLNSNFFELFRFIEK